MSQILLYLFLAGFAILLFALTRPRLSVRTGADNQPEILDLLRKFEYEQAELTATIQHRLHDMEQRIAEIEKQTLRLHDAQREQGVTNFNVPVIENAHIKGDTIQSQLELSMNLSPRHKEVVNLLRQGRAITNIAKDTGIGVGEIQLLERLLHQRQGDKL